VVLTTFEPPRKSPLLSHRPKHRSSSATSMPSSRLTRPGSLPGRS
jgi:hypothetical protein